MEHIQNPPKSGAMAHGNSRKLQSKRDPYIEWTPDMRLTVHVLQSDFKDERSTMAKRVAFTWRHQRTLPGYSVESPVPWNKISRQYVERQSQIEAQRQKWDSIVCVDFHGRSNERATMENFIERAKDRPAFSHIKDERDVDGVVADSTGGAIDDSQAVPDASSMPIKQEVLPDEQDDPHVNATFAPPASSSSVNNLQAIASKQRRPAVSAESPMIATERHLAPTCATTDGNLQRRNALMPTAATEINNLCAVESHIDSRRPKSEDLDRAELKSKDWIDAYYIHDHLTPHQRQTFEHIKSFAASRNIMERFESFEEFKDFVESHREQSESLLYSMLHDRFRDDEHELY